MRLTRSNRLLSTSAAVLAIVTLTAGPALADGSSGHSVLRAPLMGSIPDGPTIANFPPGGARWVNGPSRVRVREDGRITVTIRGLVLASSNSNPFGPVVATLVCDNMVTASTAPFGLSTGEGGGDGSTSEQTPVPTHRHTHLVRLRPADRPNAPSPPALTAPELGVGTMNAGDLSLAARTAGSDIVGVAYLSRSHGDVSATVSQGHFALWLPGDELKDTSSNGVEVEVTYRDGRTGTNRLTL